MSESANDRRSQHLDRIDVPRDLAIRAYKMAMGTDTEDVFFAAMRDQIMGSTAPKTIRLPRHLVPAAILTEMEARANRVPASGITAEPGTYLHEVCKVVA
ncbi:hypothetical protein [Paracoccus sp. MKU1]|uniref:hypothetical protein n=1 Tax=Paracoccus sp. MKU1 TaxID=1745182 RepID=UPI000723BB80|nr:hypothetical protein [Paracoccus sp. MKU1]KRW94299.1 hypothetical protein AQY21_20430 [Paracoccus sp. MKU1]